jgi:hypothetical protein
MKKETMMLAVSYLFDREADVMLCAGEEHAFLREQSSAIAFDNFTGDYVAAVAYATGKEDAK